MAILGIKFSHLIFTAPVLSPDKTIATFIYATVKIRWKSVQ
jgi:hypothetical protein